jgi:hypothetical protein
VPFHRGRQGYVRIKISFEGVGGLKGKFGARGLGEDVAPERLDWGAVGTIAGDTLRIWV